jgi:hypothetical protein
MASSWKRTPEAVELLVVTRDTLKHLLGRAMHVSFDLTSYIPSNLFNANG